MAHLALLLALLPGAAFARPGFGPRAPEPPPSRLLAKDAAYAGEVELAVDAHDVDHKAMHLRERLP